MERVAFYHCDQVGTPRTLSNELGECIWEIKQDTWGTTQEIKTLNESNPLEQTNLRFQGQYYDKETGLHYNRYRYYEPYSARYVSKDPIGLFGGLNNSAYVSDPNQWIDPMGLQNQKNKNAEDYTKAKGLMIASEERALKANLRIIEEAKAKKERIDRSLKEESLKNAKVAAEKKARQNLTYNPSGLGRDRELDHINRVEQCTANQQCTIDYMTCSASAIDINESIAINLHNGNLYAGTTLSIEQIKKIYALKTTPVPLRSGKFGFKSSVSCMLFSIRNIPKSNDRGKAVDAALDGVSLSAGAAAGIFQFGVDKSLTDPDKMFEKDKNTAKIKLSEAQKGAPFAVGMGVGFGGGTDAGIGVMTKIGNIKDMF